MKTKSLISCAVTAQLICAVVSSWPSGYQRCFLITRSAASGEGSSPALATCETSQVLLAGVPGGNYAAHIVMINHIYCNIKSAYNYTPMQFLSRYVTNSNHRK